MGLERFGMAAGGNIPNGQSVLGAMWLAASPGESTIWRANSQNGQQKPISFSSTRAIGVGQNFKRKQEFEPTIEDKEQESAFRKIKVFGIEKFPENPNEEFDIGRMGHTQKEPWNSSWVDTSFSRFGGKVSRVRQGQRPGTEKKSNFGNAGKRDAKDVAECKPWTVRKRTKPKGPKVNDILKLMQDGKWIAKARENLKGKLFSKSTIATRNAKRKKVMEIIDSCGFTTKFQEGGVTADQLLTVAAVLGEMNLKSADAYLSEVKLIQLEWGISWSDVLERQLAMLKRALRRDRGPEVRAKEVRLEDIPEEEWVRRTCSEGIQEKVVLSFAWATVWMLRAIEAAQVRVSDVSFNRKEKVVYLWIRKSKTDQKALGVKRALKCCDQSPCLRYCPWRLANDVLDGSHDRQGFLFPDVYKCHVPKVKMVKAWMDNINPEMSGHSARRSGAMMYARAGMHVHEIAMLGRWKSSCVFRYIEEAMQDIPLNQGFRPPVTSPQNPSCTSPAENNGKKESGLKTSRCPKETVTKLDVRPVVPEEIWVVSTATRRKVSHRVRQASWNLKLCQWDTWCGWHFADRNVKVTMTNKFQQGTEKCKKCEMAKASRDCVRGGVSLAQLVSLQDGPVFPSSVGKEDPTLMTQTKEAQIQPTMQKSAFAL